MTTLTHPAGVQERLEEIEGELAFLQNRLESAARQWFIAKREREHAWAEAFVRADGSVADRKAAADSAVAEARYPAGEGMTAGELEGAFEALKAKSRVLDTRAAIGMSLLRAQSRAGA